MDSLLSHNSSDFALIIVFSILLLACNIALALKHQKLTSYKQGAKLLFVGICLLITAIIGNSLMSGRWDIRYIFAFLSFVKLSPVIIFQGMAAFGYTAISFGTTTCIIVFIKKSNR